MTKRENILSELESIVLRAEAEGRGPTEEEELRFSTLEAELDTVLGETQTQTKMENTNENINVEERTLEVRLGENHEAKKASAREERTFRDAYVKNLVGKPLSQEEARALSVGSATGGGHLVPTGFVEELNARLRALSPWRTIFQNVQLGNSGPVAFPIHTTKAASNVFGEASSMLTGVTDPAFNKVTATPYKLAQILQVSEELMFQTPVALEAFLIEELANAIAELEEKLIIDGTGTGQPTGLGRITAVGGINVGSTVQATTNTVAISSTRDELILLIKGLHRRHRQNAIILMNESTHTYLARQKDLDGRPLLTMDLRGGMFDTVYGKRVIVTDYLDSLDADDKVAMLAIDPSVIKVVDFNGGLEIRRLNELYAATGQVGIRVQRWMDVICTAADGLSRFRTVDLP